MSEFVPSTVELVNRYLDRIRRQECSPTPFILEYEAKTRDLRPWAWYVTVDVVADHSWLLIRKNRPLSGEPKERLMPDQLAEHRETHHFRALCCLCVLLDGVVSYTEAAFFADAEHGYTIRCAKNRCGYRGQGTFSMHDPQR
jgi:hypothetical protein